MQIAAFLVNVRMGIEGSQLDRLFVGRKCQIKLLVFFQQCSPGEIDALNFRGLPDQLVECLECFVDSAVTFQKFGQIRNAISKCVSKQPVLLILREQLSSTVSRPTVCCLSLDFLIQLFMDLCQPGGVHGRQPSFNVSISFFRIGSNCFIQFDPALKVLDRRFEVARFIGAVAEPNLRCRCWRQSMRL